MASKRLGSIACRSAGCGGTTVAFYPTAAGLECVWTNEELPCDDAPHDDRYAAEDGHNVDLITWAEVLAWAAMAPTSRGAPALTPQPKKGPRKARKGGKR